MRPWKLGGKWKLPILGLLAALGIIVPLRASSTDIAVLKRITSRLDDRAGVLSIEASDPVPYVASQPDAHTFVVEMRDVVAVGFADNFKMDPRVPISAVHVENTRAFDGASIARVSVELAQPIRPRVRSTLAETSTAFRKLPVCSARAARIRFPTVCPDSSDRPL